MSSIRHYDRKAPGQPGHTCPDIDDIIETMEKLRKANEQLRSAADYWEDAARSLASELDDALNKLGEAEDEVSRLLDRIDRAEAA